MRSLHVVLLALVFALPSAAPTVYADLGLGAAQPERYVVGFHEWSGLEIGQKWEGALVVDVDAVLAFAVLETLDVASFQGRAEARDDVRYVEWNDPEFGYAFFVPNDARYNEAGHYGSKKIGAEAAWDRTLGAASVKVAVIDSGIRATHEDLSGSRFLGGYDTISEDNVPQDTCGHGTHVTGTIAATINNAKGIAGMAQVTIYPIRSLTSNALVLCSGSTADLAQALRLAADQGAHIASNSWGGGSATSITDAINYGHGKGMTIVAAAGNDGSCTNCVSEPWKSNAAKVIVVSSTDSNDGFSSFSSQGPQVDVAAPGSSVLSAYNSNDASYSSLSGTSMATPHVAGAAALLKTLNPSWGYSEIDARLKATAVDLGATGRDDRFGDGRINADAATASGSPPPGNVAPTACFTHAESSLTTSANGGCSSDADGTIASYSWSWGDSTPASTGATPSHTYASAGTYTVTLTVTDDDGASAQTSQQVTVTSGGDPDPSATTLTNGVARSSTSGSAGSEQFFKISVPAGRSQLQVVLDGPACGPLNCAADLDLYVRKGARPTDTAYDCRPYEGDSDETCTLANPAADWWYVRVDVYSGGNGAYTIRASY